MTTKLIHLPPARSVEYDWLKAEPDHPRRDAFKLSLDLIDIPVDFYAHVVDRLICDEEVIDKLRRELRHLWYVDKRHRCRRVRCIFVRVCHATSKMSQRVRGP